MAELTDATTNTPPSACCAAEPQTTCCEPSEKEDCCVPEGATCGCSAGASNQTDIREVVREKYAAAATGTSCCDATPRTTDENGVEV